MTNYAGLMAGNFRGALVRSTGENVGSYAINLGTLSAGTNYSLSLAPGIGRASSREKAEISVVAGALKKKKGEGEAKLTLPNEGQLPAGRLRGGAGGGNGGDR